MLARGAEARVSDARILELSGAGRWASRPAAPRAVRSIGLRCVVDRPAMPISVELACSSCGRPHEVETLVCGLCGNVLRREKAARPALAPPDAERSVEGTAEAQGTSTAPWLFLGLGLLTAPIFAWTPLLRYMAWFLASLAHEMGHAGLAWLLGMPSVPAISPGGHAAAVHGEQSALLALTVAAVLAALLWTRLAGGRRTLALAALALIYPALAFTGARDLAHLLAGHSAELLFATLCLWKALDGGFTDSRAERLLHGTLGWALLGRNASLCWGLMHSASARATYHSNGSFGLTNDYLRVAELLDWKLPAVAVVMLGACCLVLPAALGLWRLSSRARNIS